MSGAWLQASINRDMAAVKGRYVSDIPTTSSGTVTTYFIHSATTKYSWAFYHTKAVKTMYTDHNGHIVLWLTMMEVQQWLTLGWRSFSWWGRERFTVSLAYKGSQYCIYDYLQHVHQQKTFPSGRTGCVRVDALRKSRQSHPGGGLLRARRQYHTSSCILLSDRRFAVSSRSVGLLF